MSDRLAAADRALATRGGFERDTDETFTVTSTPFEATLRLDADDGGVRYVVEMSLPTLDAVVADESVAAVVEDGWYETFERRLEDLDGALRAEATAPEVDRDDVAQTVTVTASFVTDRPDHGAEDAAALVGYIEGTYVEGAIPGYTYREPLSGLLEQAYDRSQAAIED